MGTKIKRSDLRRIIKPIVKEVVEEVIEDLLLEDGYMQRKIQESVLKGGVISHVIAEVVKGVGVIGTPSYNQPIVNEQQYGNQVQPQQQQGSALNARLEEHIKSLRNDTELKETLQQRSQRLEQEILAKAKGETVQVPVQQSAPPQQQVAQQTPARNINWRALSGVQLPPDDDSVMHNTTLAEASNPLASAKGSGIDLSVIEAMTGGKGIWDKRKMKAFLDMGEKKWHKKVLAENNDN